MRLKLFATALALSTGVAGAACYPDRLDGVSYDIVASVHDSTADFGGANTYALVDTVIHLVIPGGGDNISRVVDPTILASIRSNMALRGYTEVSATTAELSVIAAVSSSEYTQYYWDYWCGIYWYGCYYPPYYGSYTYTTGTLFVAMQDRRGVGAAADGNLIWLSIGNGLLNTVPSPARVQDAINTMFAQSPYLQSN